GFRGNAGKANGKVVKGYDLLIGGRLDGRTLLGQQFASLLDQDDVVAVATAAVREYAALANTDEAFDSPIDRIGLHLFAERLARNVALQQGEWTEPLTGPQRETAELEPASAALEVKAPRMILKWALKQYGDSLLVTSALGAGGVLLAQYLREIAPQH